MFNPNFKNFFALFSSLKITRREFIESYSSVQNILIEDTFLIVEDDQIKCLICGISYVFDPRKGTFPVKRHIQTLHHFQKTNDALTRQLRENNGISVQTREENYSDICDLFTKLELPLSILDKPAFKEFIVNHINFQLPSSSLIRKNTLPKN